jgi:hypothetical protein
MTVWALTLTCLSTVQQLSMDVLGELERTKGWLFHIANSTTLHIIHIHSAAS